MLMEAVEWRTAYERTEHDVWYPEDPFSLAFPALFPTRVGAIEYLRQIAAQFEMLCLIMADRDMGSPAPREHQHRLTEAGRERASDETDDRLVEEDIGSLQDGVRHQAEHEHRFVHLVFRIGVP